MAAGSGSEEKETKKAWEEVGTHFSSVGKQVGEHYRKLEQDAGAASAEERRSLNAALKDVVEKLDQAFTGLGNALRDPGTQDSLKRAGKSLGNALDTTFSKVGDEIRQRTRKKNGGEDSASSGGSGSQPSS
jgi:Flp pilus assembly pilin Flp